MRIEGRNSHQWSIIPASYLSHSAYGRSKPSFAAWAHRLLPIANRLVRWPLSVLVKLDLSHQITKNCHTESISEWDYPRASPASFPDPRLSRHGKTLDELDRVPFGQKYDDTNKYSELAWNCKRWITLSKKAIVDGHFCRYNHMGKTRWFRGVLTGSLAKPCNSIPSIRRFEKTIRRDDWSSRHRSKDKGGVENLVTRHFFLACRQMAMNSRIGG